MKWTSGPVSGVVGGMALALACASVGPWSDAIPRAPERGIDLGELGLAPDARAAASAGLPSTLDRPSRIALAAVASMGGVPQASETGLLLVGMDGLAASLSSRAATAPRSTEDESSDPAQVVATGAGLSLATDDRFASTGHAAGSAAPWAPLIAMLFTPDVRTGSTPVERGDAHEPQTGQITPGVTAPPFATSFPDAMPVVEVAAAVPSPTAAPDSPLQPGTDPLALPGAMGPSSASPHAAADPSKAITIGQAKPAGRSGTPVTDAPTAAVPLTVKAEGDGSSSGGWPSGTGTPVPPVGTAALPSPFGATPSTGSPTAAPGVAPLKDAPAAATSPTTGPAMTHEPVSTLPSLSFPGGRAAGPGTTPMSSAAPGVPTVILPDPVLDRIANGMPAPGEHGKSPFLLPPPFQGSIIPVIAAAAAVAVPEPGTLLLTALALTGLLAAGRKRRG